MATATNVTVTGSSDILRGGLPPRAEYEDLIDLFETKQGGTWFQANKNKYRDTFIPNAFRVSYPLPGGTDPNVSVGNYEGIINAWAGVAWDDDACRFYLFGGGHNNTSATDSFIWESRTMKWKMAFLPHDGIVKAAPKPNYPAWFENVTKLGWGLDAPPSMHTYTNLQWLRKSRLVYLGNGATQPTGAPPAICDKVTGVWRQAGPYTVSLEKAGTGCVGVADGGNVKRPGTASANVDLVGANAWKNRDYWKDHPQASGPTPEILYRGRSAYAVVENDHDVIYTTSSSQTDPCLVRIEMVDSDYRNDIITHAGAFGAFGASDTGMVVDTDRNLAMYCPLNPSGVGRFGYWNLNTKHLGLSNPLVVVQDNQLTGPDVADFLAKIAADDTYGTAYDRYRKCFVVFLRKGGLYEVHLPKVAPFNVGWKVKRIYAQTPGAPFEPQTARGTVCGKFKRSERLDAFVYLSDNDMTAGDVWFYKPIDWRNPRA